MKEIIERLYRIGDYVIVSVFSTFGILMVLMLIASLATGCRGLTTEKCASAAQIYTSYVDALERGQVLGPGDIERARLAGEMLVISCGWAAMWEAPPAGTVRSRTTSWKVLTRENGETVPVPLDSNYVPVVRP